MIMSSFRGLRGFLGGCTLLAATVALAASFAPMPASLASWSSISSSAADDWP